MSYTELFKVPEQGEIISVAEFSNSHRGAMLVWMNMCQEFLGQEVTYLMLSDKMQLVWDLFKNPLVPYQLRIVMASTFDNVMVKRENLPELADAFEFYCIHYQDGGHLWQQARKLHELAKDPTCFAVCWNQTSVNSDVWQVVDETKPEEGDERWRMYDVSKDTGHWFLFDEVKQDLVDSFKSLTAKTEDGSC